MKTVCEPSEIVLYLMGMQDFALSRRAGCIHILDFLLYRRNFSYGRNNGLALCAPKFKLHKTHL
jgi:hypothetical protein